MNLEMALRDRQALRKASYSMLKKLHKLEHSNSFKDCVKVGDKYYIILTLQHIIDVLNYSFQLENDEKKYLNDLTSAIKTMSKKSVNNRRINRKLLVSSLKKHTKFFNSIEDKKTIFICDDVNYHIWNLQCVPSYLAQFDL